jgi:hypothetical protein
MNPDLDDATFIHREAFLLIARFVIKLRTVWKLIVRIVILLNLKMVEIRPPNFRVIRVV